MTSVAEPMQTTLPPGMDERKMKALADYQKKFKEHTEMEQKLKNCKYS